MKKIFFRISCYLPYVVMWIALDIFIMLFTRPDTALGLLFTVAWSLLFASTTFLFPRLGGQIFFGVFYGICLTWTMIQAGYHCVFGKLMWIRDLFYVSEGIGFLGDTLRTLPPMWWVGGILLIGLWILLIWKFPKQRLPMIPTVVTALVSVALCVLLPYVLFIGSSNYKSVYKKLPNAKTTHSICGLYQLTVRDVWDHIIHEQKPVEVPQEEPQADEIDAYFASRAPHEDNDMTGTYADKNVILVLMESMDDWLITQDDTPTLYRLMDEGINFTSFYTPGFGTARTLNTEFCMNTGIYLPTEGAYVFDYLDNNFDPSLASQLTKKGYSAEVFHYNSPDFYSRGELEPAIGYSAYHCYGDYTDPANETQIYSDCMLFDVQPLRDRFFREGKTLNTIITRSAHLGYAYDEELSAYALTVYPDYYEKFSTEEEDCIRVKAKLVDDMFARLLLELESNGSLKNTVIIGITDHYAYGMDDEELLMELSGVEESILLERTPCFIWSAGGPDLDVDKTVCTVDFLPTVLNLLGIDSPYHYLGYDAFDESYPGYVLFPDGSWLRDGLACRVKTNGEPEVIANLSGRELSLEQAQEMMEISQSFIRVSNLLLQKDYYGRTKE